ncbi:hypothetical protein CDD82_4479 [Ophiocordyceps australis]|uniref:Pyroglutamyl-peptidase I n=1 Tax=Ophiocordyceps australis TaxID=1399860 RepID=A0A2C5YBB4_9HYPO|nr:hypothetical protein CDD82_4479 [Ophiocordyceps australis]
MGSRSSDQGETDEELTVLITGFGPFRDQYPVNPSWEIVRGLPPYLPPLHHAKTPRVRLVVHPAAIRVNYDSVQSLVPTFWNPDGYMGHRIDLAVHLGMAGPRPCYQIERRGHGRGYTAPDVDGCRPDCPDLHQDACMPDEIETDLDLDDVLKRWQRHSADDLDLRISEDAGRYLCDFIYYSSLLTLWKQQRPRRVVFLHVPCACTDVHIVQGRQLVLSLVQAIVESRQA